MEVKLPIAHLYKTIVLRNSIIITGVFAHGLDEMWLGRIIDEKCINELVKLQKKFNFNIAGEGGEFETLVVDGPIFKKRLILDDVLKEWKRDSGILKVKKSHLEKN